MTRRFANNQSIISADDQISRLVSTDLGTGVSALGFDPESVTSKYNQLNSEISDVCARSGARYELDVLAEEAELTHKMLYAAARDSAAARVWLRKDGYGDFSPALKDSFGVGRSRSGWFSSRATESDGLALSDALRKSTAEQRAEFCRVASVLRGAAKRRFRGLLHDSQADKAHEIWESRPSCEAMSEANELRRTKGKDVCSSYNSDPFQVYSDMLSTMSSRAAEGKDSDSRTLFEPVVPGCTRWPWLPGSGMPVATQGDAESDVGGTQNSKDGTTRQSESEPGSKWADSSGSCSSARDPPPPYQSASSSVIKPKMEPSSRSSWWSTKAGKGKPWQ